MKTASSPKPANAPPVALPRWRRRLLGAAIALEAAWIALLIVLAIAR
jgi:hypothetical protein